MFSVKDIKSSSKTLTKEQVVEMFPNVFDEGLGLFEGEYHSHPSSLARLSASGYLDQQCGNQLSQSEKSLRGPTMSELAKQFFHCNRNALCLTGEAPPLGMPLALLTLQYLKETTPPPVAPPIVSESAEISSR